MLFLVALVVSYLLSGLFNWFRLVLQMTYCLIIAKKKTILCIWLSILVQTETNIVLKKCLHYLVRASNDSGLFDKIFLFHEW